MNKQTLTIIDPTEMDGNPYEVAGRSLRQVQGLLEYAESALDSSLPMVRNAWMSRNLVDTEEPGTPEEWDKSPINLRIEALALEISKLIKSFEYVIKAAEYDPKNPPKA
jgi:hypothetical protein